MGSTELAANLFRATQTDEKLRRENLRGKKEAGDAHYEVGKKVRKTIAELGGTMPEELPTPNKSIKQIEKEESKRKEQAGSCQPLAKRKGVVREGESEGSVMSKIPTRGTRIISGMKCGAWLLDKLKPNKLHGHYGTPLRKSRKIKTPSYHGR